MKLAIVGATGLVGQTLLKILSEKNFPATHLSLVASKRSSGKHISYLDQTITVHDLTTFDFSKVNLAFFAAGSEVSKTYAPIAAEKNCWVIDKSAYFRNDPQVPLIVPEINGYLLKTTPSKIIATPNCSTTQLVMALKPIQDLAGLERIEVATYQAVSGAGLLGMQELEAQGKGQVSSVQKFMAPIAYNVIPSIDTSLDSGFTKEEMKMQEETCKILDCDIIVNATAVRVPVFQGHSEAVHLKTHTPIDLAKVMEAWRQFPGLHFDPSDVPMPLTHAQNNALVWLGRLRRHPKDDAHYLNFWIVSDNLYKGAAYNALQIAQYLQQEYNGCDLFNC